MKVVALCNKLTRSRTLLKDALDDPEAATEKPVAVVSNMTTGKTAEVRFFHSIYLAYKISCLFLLCFVISSCSLKTQKNLKY